MMKKRILCLVLAVLLALGTMPMAFASDMASEEAAARLYDLGLFKGVGNDPDGQPIFELDREPNRYEAVTMLVRLLGMEQAALAGTWETPFTDVVAWAAPYVGYAYANGLTNGISATKFGGSEPVQARHYLTFILRALGYSSASDFAWDAPWILTDDIGLTNGEYSIENNYIDRGDVAVVSLDALSVCKKDSEVTIADELGLIIDYLRILSWPESISRNEIATVRIKGKPNTIYNITVYYKSGPSNAEGLEAKVSDENGYASWSWKIGPNTSSGTFAITVYGGGESETVNFTIQPHSES